MKELGFTLRPRVILIWGSSNICEAEYAISHAHWHCESCYKTTRVLCDGPSVLTLTANRANQYCRIQITWLLHMEVTNPLSPHDALNHHFASLKNGLISWNLLILEQKNSWICLKNNSIFFHLSSTSSHFHPLQVENCDSNSRLVVDEDDNGKFRLKRVKI